MRNDAAAPCFIQDIRRPGRAAGPRASIAGTMPFLVLGLHPPRGNVRVPALVHGFEVPHMGALQALLVPAVDIFIDVHVAATPGTSPCLIILPHFPGLPSPWYRRPCSSSAVATCGQEEGGKSSAPFFFLIAPIVIVDRWFVNTFPAIFRLQVFIDKSVRNRYH